MADICALLSATVAMRVTSLLDDGRPVRKTLHSVWFYTHLFRVFYFILFCHLSLALSLKQSYTAACADITMFQKNISFKQCINMQTNIIITLNTQNKITVWEKSPNFHDYLSYVFFASSDSWSQGIVCLEVDKFIVKHKTVLLFPLFLMDLTMCSRFLISNRPVPHHPPNINVNSAGCFCEEMFLTDSCCIP